MYKSRGDIPPCSKSADSLKVRTVKSSSSSATDYGTSEGSSPAAFGPEMCESGSREGYCCGVYETGEGYLDCESQHFRVAIWKQWDCISGISLAYLKLDQNCAS